MITCSRRERRTASNTTASEAGEGRATSYPRRPGCASSPHPTELKGWGGNHGGPTPLSDRGLGLPGVGSPETSRFVGAVMTSRKPSPPKGTGAGGKRLWFDVLNGFELDEHEMALLIEATRTVDLLDELDAAVKSEGAVIDSPHGRKAHPAAVEARQQRIALARLLAALRLPSGDTEDQPQRRGGARGTYQLGAAK